MRRARAADAETLARTVRLGQETWRAFAPAGWEPPPVGAHIGVIRRYVEAPGAWALLAHVDGEPAALCVMLRGDWDKPASVILRGLFVRPAWWGSGLADLLHEAFVEEARGRGHPQAWLTTPAAHARARRFYERRGWRADTLLEQNRGMPMAVYGRPLLPPAAGGGENQRADASVRSRP